MNHAQFWGGAAAPYEIEQSLRFDGSSGYLNWTPSSAGDRTLWTWSAWIKRSGLSSTVGLFGSYAAANNTDYLEILFASGNNLLIQGNNTAFLKTSQLFRDTSAWYHIVIAVDTSNATANDRIKLWVNGEQVTAFDTRNNPSSGGNLGVNQAGVHRLGRRPNGTDYFNGYMAEVNFIDGSALTPSDFGEEDDNGVWRPIAYTGTYGTNGFYLKFDPSATNGIGHDHSGNGNNWTPTGFTTSGVGTDVMSDTPTTNYATLNPLWPADVVESEGNLVGQFPNNPWKQLATMGMTSGKYYWEVDYPSFSAEGSHGIANDGTPVTGHVGQDANSWAYFSSGLKSNNDVTASYGNSWTGTDIIGVAFDADGGNLYFYKNGTVQNSGTAAYTGLTNGPYYPAFGDNSSTASSTVRVNFGQRAFSYSPPSGFSALNTSTLPEPDIADGSEYFSTTLYTGVSGSQSVDAGMATDLAWIKSRSGNQSHSLTDRVRGNDLVLQSNETSAETSGNIDLTSTGVTISDDNALRGASGVSYVLWSWLAGGSGSSNTDGSITSTVSASPSSGFSIVTYSGQTSNFTWGHELGVAPSMVLIKGRTNTAGWSVYHSALGATKRLALNTSDAAETMGYFQNTEPTSTVFSVTTNGGTGASGVDYVAYCFAEVEGYSKFGSYTGNGSTDGPFIATSFTPAWVMLKRSDSLGTDWIIQDAARSTYNVVDDILRANTNQAEASGNSNYYIDFLSNGIKLRTASAAWNASGGTYVFACFASNPFGGDGVSPATAR